MFRIHKCARCHHEWPSRTLPYPIRCPSCGARSWWRRAREKRPRENRGRRAMFPISDLKVGEGRLFAWRTNAIGERDDRLQRSMHISIRQAAVRANITIRKDNTHEGLLVTRVK